MSAVIDGAESDTAVSEGTVVTPLEGEVYSPNNLEMKAETDSVALSWDHAGCIHEYMVRLCDGMDECQLQVVAGEVGSSHVQITIGSLQACTEYKVQIFASTGDKELAAPEQLNLDLNDKKSLQQGSGEEELLRETSDTSVDIESTAQT